MLMIRHLFLCSGNRNGDHSFLDLIIDDIGISAGLETVFSTENLFSDVLALILVSPGTAVISRSYVQCTHLKLTSGAILKR